MAASNMRMAAIKAEVTELQSRIGGAATKDEAIELAISAAELCMRALKLATNADEKSEMSSRCNNLLSEAESIKKTNEWRSSTGFSNYSSSETEATSVRRASDIGHVGRVKRLREPVSTRDLSKAEQLLILRASKLNNCTFQPWKGPPDSGEFELRAGERPFLDPTEIGLSSYQMDLLEGWKSAKDALPPPAWFPGDRTDLGPTMQVCRTVDLVQDAATDCSVVASLCAGTARGERGHPRILSGILFPYDMEKMRPIISSNGKYIIRLNFNGCYRKVTIDDRLPVSKTRRTLHVIDRRNPALLWPALIEKAYLKVRGGYDFPGSNSGTDLWILTGWIPEQVFLQSDDTVPSQLWKRVSNAFRYGDVLVTMGTGKMSRRTEKELGLAAQHDYAVLDMKEENDQRLFLLKNPWCEGTSWKGTLPRSSSTGKDMSSLGSIRSSSDTSSSSSSPDSFPRPEKQLAPGTFWIDLDNVIQHFDSIYLNWNPGLFTHRQDIHFPWDLSDGTRAGSAGSFVSHPQISLSSKAGGVAWLLLSRHFKDCIATYESDDLLDLQPHFTADLAGYIGIHAYDKGGERVYISDIALLQRGPYVDSPQTLLRLELPPTSEHTIVVDGEGLSPSRHTFTLSAFSNSAIHLAHARNKYSFQTDIDCAWTETTAGGNVHEPTHSQNPQFRLNVLDRTAIALLLETPQVNVNVHVRLVHGRGRRVVSIGRRDIIVDSGDYRRGSALAELEELEAGLYTIICSTFEAGQKAPFTLRVHSTADTHVKLLPAEGAGQLPVRLANACFGQNVNKIAAPLRPRRLVRLNVITKFLRSVVPFERIEDPLAPDPVRTRSPLRVTIEVGRGPERRILIASSGGEYSDVETGVRTEDVDLSPNQLQSGDMWLVLDRLSGPAAGGEEWYTVELSCEGVGGEALGIGVWREWDD